MGSNRDKTELVRQNELGGGGLGRGGGGGGGGWGGGVVGDRGFLCPLRVEWTMCVGGI